jgi:triosephosphate isomerase
MDSSGNQLNLPSQNWSWWLKFGAWTGCISDVMTRDMDSRGERRR